MRLKSLRALCSKKKGAIMEKAHHAGSSGNGRSVDRDTVLRYTRRSICWIRRISGPWATTLTCVSMFIVIGMEKPITLHRRPGKTDRVGRVFRQMEEMRLFVSPLLVEFVKQKTGLSSTGVSERWIVKIVESIENQVGLRWKTVVVVARVLADESTITEAVLCVDSVSSRWKRS